MKPIIIIDTFKSVFFYKNKKPIVFCDIDHTFIRPIRDYNDIFEQMKSDFTDPNELNDIVSQMFEVSMTMGLVKQTDQKGFSIMLDKIKLPDGKLVFLTARSSISHNKTVSDLKKAGIENPDLYEIHYTSNQMTKGEYIKQSKLLEGYDHFIFIDDYPHFLESALKIYPDMDCYLFKYKR